ncbi:carbohydrate ABC transporter permease [Anaerolineales bacterium]
MVDSMTQSNTPKISKTTSQMPQLPGGSLWKISLYVILSIAAVIAVIPFFWMISRSLMTLGETINNSIVPAVPQWKNYEVAWREANFSLYFVNSVIITLITITGIIITSILAGYAFGRMKFYGKNFVFAVLLATLMIPESVIMIPNFLTVAGRIFPLPIITQAFPPSFDICGGWISTCQTTWINTLPALTIPFLANAFSIFLLRQFFAQIPDELWDAARIDGAGHFRFLWQVCVPISRPAVLTVVLLTFIAAWNAFLWPLLVTTRPDWRPLMVGLYTFVSEAGAETHLMMAGACITILPMLILYFLTQRSFTEGIATTGLKG